jgi:cyclopropane fatty-acyl-phospholipid synthase-like methyltransferase
MIPGAGIWDERYRSDEYIYGTEPNVFFSEQLLKLKPGRILLPAEGEGRNAVFAAKNGWDVFAFDQSKEGRNKAMKLAGAYNVHINYNIADAALVDYLSGEFDAAALIYTHFPPAQRSVFFEKLKGSLKPGGVLIFECFSKRQTEYRKNNPNAGGPVDESLLYTTEEMKEAFSDMQIVFLAETEIMLNEGKLHSGTSSVVRMIAVRG